MAICSYAKASSDLRFIYTVKCVSVSLHGNVCNLCTNKVWLNVKWLNVKCLNVIKVKKSHNCLFKIKVIMYTHGYHWYHVAN